MRPTSTVVSCEDADLILDRVTTRRLESDRVELRGQHVDATITVVVRHRESLDDYRLAVTDTHYADGPHTHHVESQFWDRHPSIDLERSLRAVEQHAVDRFDAAIEKLEDDGAFDRVIISSGSAVRGILRMIEALHDFTWKPTSRPMFVADGVIDDDAMLRYRSRQMYGHPRIVLPEQVARIEVP